MKMSEIKQENIEPGMDALLSCFLEKVNEKFDFRQVEGSEFLIYFENFECCRNCNNLTEFEYWYDYCREHLFYFDYLHHPTRFLCNCFSINEKKKVK